MRHDNHRDDVGAGAQVFDRLSIRAKAVAAPIVLSLCLLFISLTSYRALSSAIDQIRNISRDIVRGQAAVLALKDEIFATEILVQRYVTLASNQASPSFLLKLRVQIEDNSRHIGQAMNGAQLGLAADLIGHWSQYTAQVKDVLDVGSSDAPMATMMLGQTDDKFLAITQLIKERGSRISEALTRSVAVLETKANESLNETIIEAVMGLLIGGVISAFALRSIAGPIRTITTRMKQLSMGDVSATIGYQARPDEVGDMARAIEVFRVTALRARNLETEKIEADSRRAEERTKELSSIAGEFRNSVASIVERVTELTHGVQDTAQAVAACSKETMDQSQLTRGTIDIAQKNVDSVAFSTHALRSTIEELALQTSSVKELSLQTSEQTVSTTAEIETLSNSVDRIASVVQFIQRLAQQTSLLALNATIEAARAGEAGRGFAVVAAEVKSLSYQVGQAAHEISAKISAVQQSRDVVSLSTEQVIKTIRVLGECSSAMAAAIEHQAASTSHISENAQSAADQSAQARSQSSALSSQADRADQLSSRLLGEAKLLVGQAGALGDKADEFLRYLSAS